jgi:hypothetical protein
MSNDCSNTPLDSIRYILDNGVDDYWITTKPGADKVREVREWLSSQSETTPSLPRTCPCGNPANYCTDCRDGDVSTAVSATQAITDVLAERRRQVESEGWDAEHDDGHAAGDLALAGACYAANAAGFAEVCDVAGACVWPWASEWWKPKDKRRDLVRAAALIVAEIERLDRAKPKLESDRRSLGYDRLDR